MAASDRSSNQEGRNIFFSLLCTEGGKRCSENMQEIYRRTPMPKCDFNKFGMLLFINKNNFIPFYNIIQ